MSLKKLFGQGVKNYESASVNVESSTFVDKKVKEQETYLPPIDFATASNFVKYGLAELYYDSSISRIYDNYPYDGSKAEIIDFHQSSSYLDRWMYEEKYPKSTGYVSLGSTGYQGGMTNGYGNTTTNEFIRVWGGIHTASAGMSTKPLRETFDKSGKYNLNLNRTQNWRCNPVSGSTIEFWLRIPSFNSALTERQVILHLDNGVTPGTAGGGSLVLQIYRTTTDNGRFQLSMKDGTSTPSGPLLQDVSDAITDASFGVWHHYALTIINGSTGLDTTLYVDGVETKKVLNIGSSGLLAELPGLINGYVGALQTTTPSGQGGLGKGKLRAYLDEFRFWKKARTGQQIGLNWFRQVGGGANSDDSTANKDLGVYFRFNEGITGIVSTDQTVLDYSGRLANGYWQGYTSSTQRNTGSAMASSSYAYVEDENPIIYSTDPRVISLKTEMQTSGSLHDNEIGGSIFHSLPSWMTDQDLEEGSGNLRNLTQIVASYFDTLYAQVSAVPNLKNKGYIQEKNKPLPFASKLLTDKGFIVRNIFADAEIVNMFSGVDFDSIKFEEQLDRTKNLIYTNIYNNLEAIYKAKGTEKSIRNLIRCFGVDDEILKLNVYTDGGIHYFTDKTKGSSVKKKYMNFDDPSYFSSTLFQTSSATNDLTFITGSVGSISASNNAFTLEADIVVPHKRAANEKGYFDTPFLSSSVFGFHEAVERYPGDYTWATSVTASLGVYLVRDELNSKNAKFVVKSQDETIYLTSGYIQNIYDNNHWNMALRVKPDTYPYAGNVTNTTPNFNVEFYAANYNFDILENEISLTKSVSYASGSAFLSNPKRVYAGANLLNFTGSVVEQSDIQVGGVRAWLDYLEDSTIQQHNKDPLNYGNSESYRGSNIFTVAEKNIPSEELTIFNWEFDVVTGSSATGDFIINDLTSGSTDVIYDSWLDEIIRREYRGKGYSFGATQTSFVENEYLYAQRKELPEISYTNDNVFIKTEKDINFIVDDDVSDNFYALEKSLNQIVSEEMLKSFATIQEFANLMGRPVDRYRMNYKRLEKVRQDFFNRVEGDPDQERFMNFYKWIDGSISQMINQLIPAGVNFGSGVTDVVESHILERNKYQRRVGLLDQLESTEGSMKGVEELTYNYKFGHAPVESTFWPKYLQIGKTTIGTVGIPIDSVGTFSPAIGSADWAFYARIQMPTAAGPIIIYGARVAHPTTFSWKINVVPTQISFDFLDSGGSGKTKTWYVPSAGLTSNWHHLAIFYDATHGHADDAIKIFLDGDEKSVTASDPHSISGIFNFEEIRLQAGNSIAAAWNIDEFGIIKGSLSEAQANELYNNDNYRNITSYSDLANVFLHYRIGQNGLDSAANLGTLYPQIGSHNLTVRNLPTVGNPQMLPYNPLWGEIIVLEGDKNCLWRHERQIRVGTNSTDREAIREISINQTNATSSALSTADNVIYQGSTFIDRRLSRPYKIGIEFGNNIHAGTNYNLQKDREFYKRATQWFSAKDSAGVMENVYTVGITTGSAIIEQQICDDIYNPSAKKFKHFDCVVGRNAQGIFGDEPTSPSLEYIFKMNSSMYWPFNVVSGSVNSGYNSEVVTHYNSSSIVTNLHSDTIDLTNEISIQGPFTEAHVGGNQFRHQPLNKFDATLTNPGGGATPNNLRNVYTRAEGYRYLFGENPLSDPTLPSDGAMGLTGPDYGVIPGGKAGDTTKKFAVWFREERAKRPVNIKNIQSTTGSSVLGNYEHKYEVVSTFGMLSQRFRMRNELSTTGDSLFGVTYSTLPQTTQPSSLLQQGCFLSSSSPVTFRIGTTSQLPSQLSGALAQKTIVRTRFSAPGGPETMSEAFLNISSQEFSAYNALPFRNLTIRSSGSGEPGTIRVNSNLNKREGMQTMLRRHTGKFGVDGQYGVINSGPIMDQPAAFFKQHRNTLVTPRINGETIRNAIESPATTILAAGAQARFIQAPWPTTGPVSFSFWLKINSFPSSTAVTQTVLYAEKEGTSNGSYAISIGKDASFGNTIDFSFSDPWDSVTKWRLDQFQSIVSLGDWNFITITWNGDRNTTAKFYIGNQSYSGRLVISNATTNTRKITNRVRLFDLKFTTDTRELDGALANFAVWRKEITPSQVSNLFESQGRALAVSFYSSLVEYWKFNTGTVPGTGITNGTTFLSEIGGDNLIAYDNLTSSVGPYSINTSEDVNQYNNMNYNSLLPRSDFQYSWIRQTLSGSNWMDKQKVRGYAPKSGEMVIVGNGAMTKLETAIDWPLISDIECCPVSSPTITITWPADGDAQPGGKESTSTTLVTDTFYIVTSAPAKSDELRLTGENQLPITPSANFISCCEIEYCIVMKGHINGVAGPVVDAYPACQEPWSTSQPAYGTNNGDAYNFTQHAGDGSKSVFVKFMARCGKDGSIVSIETEFKNAYATAIS